MHFWLLLTLYGCFLVHVISRPPQTDYNNDSDLDENEEENDEEPAADMYSAEDTQLNDQEPAAQGDEVPRSRHLMDLPQSRYMHFNAPDDNTVRVKSDTLSETRVMRNRDLTDENSDSTNYNEQSRSFSKHGQSNKYNDAINEQSNLENSASNDIGKSSRFQGDNPVNKRTVGFDVGANEEGDMIFEKNNRDHISHNKNEYNSNMASDAEQQRYFKQYYNTMQAENREMGDDKTHDGAHYNLRDRREVKLPSHLENTQENKATNPKSDNEDEESAIKRHIKKLSSEELEQLLSSLTEEKRELLKKIIDETDSNTNAYINKREITKKAEAVEEINYIENCQSDLSKMQGGSSSLDISAESASSQNTDVTEGSKQQPDSQTDNTDLSSKSSESNLVSVSNVELTNSIDDSSQKQSSNLNTVSLNGDSKNKVDVAVDAGETSKNENKREVNFEDLDEAEESLDVNGLPGQDYSNDQGYLSDQDETLADLMDKENQQRDDKAYKREISYDKQSELSDSFKSLEDSFPNSNAYDDSGSYSGPLVRVKRKNYDQNLNKRSAELPTDNKVAYFPYEAEIEEEENNEGNEFDDEGFYDRTSNFANNNKGISDLSHKSEISIQAKKSVNNPKLSKYSVDSDTMSLGSDTDSVLSGVEGVDDNLMYSSGTRNRRTPEDNFNAVSQSKIESSTILAESDARSAADSYVNAPHYQENDAFGPLPRSYDGDLARYKRIRRVKQPPPEEQSPDPSGAVQNNQS